MPSSPSLFFKNSAALFIEKKLMGLRMTVFWGLGDSAVRSTAHKF